MIPKAFTALAKMKPIFVLTIVKEPLGTVGYAAYHISNGAICYGPYHIACQKTLPVLCCYIISNPKRKPSNVKKYSIETAEELFNLYSPYTRKLRDLGKLFYYVNLCYFFLFQALIFRGRSQKRLTLKTEVTHFKV